MSNNLYTIILAAGKGTRMKSDLPKVIHKINDKELVKYVIDQAIETGSDETYIVVGYKRELVENAVANYAKNLYFVEQKEQLGTGHAVMMAEEALKGKSGNILILCGDVPLLKSDTLNKFLTHHNNSKATATVLTTEFNNPFGYGRIITDDNGNITKIVEEKDANEEEKKVKEINSGVYLIDAELMFSSLKQITSDNAQNEYYLTDVMSILKKQNKKISTFKIEDNNEILGINTLDQLSLASDLMNK